MLTMWLSMRYYFVQGGFVGVLPALGLLDPAIDGHGPVVLSTGQQLIWALSVSLFGECSVRETLLRVL